MNTKKITGLLILAILLNSFIVFGQKRDINLVFIGNSITYGSRLADPANDAPPVKCAAYLKNQAGIGAVEFSNQGHSGYTTLDFLPATKTFEQVEQAAGAFTNKQAQLIFSLKLGTNDSAIHGPHGSPVSIENYKGNLKAIIDRLLNDFPGCIIILQHPIWYSNNTYNGAMYLQEGLTRLQSYMPVIDGLVKEYAATQPKRVFVGDKKAFNYFKKNHLTDLDPENGHQGTFYLHPNKKGAEALGIFWAKAILKCLKRLG